MLNKQKISRRSRIKLGIRKKIRGTESVPRLCVFKSNRSIYAFVVNDDLGNTLASASTLSKDFEAKGIKTEQAKEIGKIIGQKCVEKNISKVVFDRNGYLYHGRVKAIAEGARESGLIF